MSLSTMLSDKTEKAIQFQNIIKNVINPRPNFSTISGNKPFSGEYKELVPYNLSNRYYASLIGTGFDYMARFIIAKSLDDKKLKKYVMNNLVAEHGLSRMEKFADKKIYSTLEKKYDKAITVFEKYVNNKKFDFTEILYSVGYFSAIEAVARSGMPPVDIKKSLLDNTEKEIIIDLQRMCEVFEEKFMGSGIVKKKDNDIVFNPTFGISSLLVGGADADLFINGTLIDFKCTKDKGYRWMDFAQLVSYYLLSIIAIRSGDIGIHENEFAVNKLAFYKGRFGEIEYIDINILDKTKIEQAISDLQKLWELKFIY